MIQKLALVTLSVVMLGAALFAPVANSQYVARSPEYGVNGFLLGVPETTDRDIGLISSSGFEWVKLIVPWRSIEYSCKSCLDWGDMDRVVSATTAAGLKLMVRVDSSPPWAAATAADNSPPANPA